MEVLEADQVEVEVLEADHVEVEVLVADQVEARRRARSRLAMMTLYNTMTVTN